MYTQYIKSKLLNLRTLISLSGVIGIILIIINVVGTFYEYANNDYILLGGIFMIVGVALPLFIIERIRYNRKINKIIESYKDSHTKKTEIPKIKSKIKGWSMNDSPFRDRRSGASWGGGNIKGANATRGTRKGFLK